MSDYDYGTPAEEMFKTVSSPEGDEKSFPDPYELFDRN